MNIISVFPKSFVVNRISSALDDDDLKAKATEKAIEGVKSLLKDDDVRAEAIGFVNSILSDQTVKMNAGDFLSEIFKREMQKLCMRMIPNQWVLGTVGISFVAYIVYKNFQPKDKKLETKKTEEKLETKKTEEDSSQDTTPTPRRFVDNVNPGDDYVRER